mmetsp:Transcript_17243/g.24978  ORF Transcript_17243/g.24978 Transcript_17243/m.24978 type:complete len:169 (-) Transcript_17243:1394-1900(-)
MFFRSVSKFRNVSQLVRNFSQQLSPPHIPAALPGLSEEQLKKIEVTDKFLRTKHKLLDDMLSPEERDIVRRKRMIYRSKQRGWLEADILMGSWATKYVPTLTSVELDDYDVLLDEETIDIFNYITGKDPLPDHLKSKTVMKRLQQYAIDTKLSEPNDYATLKREQNLT